MQYTLYLLLNMQDDLCKKVGAYFRGVHFSGNADNRAQAGLVFAYAFDAPSNANANIGSHLTYRISMSQGGKLNKNYTT